MTDAEETTVAHETTVIGTPLADTRSSRPHIRWGALVWGLIAIAAAGWTLSIVGTPGSRQAFFDWFTGLTSGGWVVVGVFVVGGFILLRGLVALLGLTQRSRR